MVELFSGFRPMLSYRVEDFARLTYPVLASPKLDGIRAVVFDNVLYSRTLKPIRNRFIQEQFANERNYFDGMDGELMVNTADNFSETTSGIMSTEGEPAFIFHVFDRYHPTEWFMRRYMNVEEDIKRIQHPRIRAVPHAWIENAQALMNFEVECLRDGHEGAMVRSVKGAYKRGRSTALEGGLGKIKRFMDAEAIIIGFEPLYRNQNEPTRNALGLQERSKDASGRVADELLGNLICLRPNNDIPFEIGTGFTERQRITFWRDRASLLEKWVKYKHLPYGAKDKPRHPVFLGFRDGDDL